MKTRFRIEIADTREKYEGLRALWCEVFKDEPEFIDGMYTAFGADIGAGKFTSSEIAGYAVCDEEGRMLSALTCYNFGEYAGKPVYVSYAICTAEDARGLGYAGALVSYVRDMVTERGGISLISPAEDSLENYYARFGYEPYFYAAEKIICEDDEEFIFDEEDAGYEKADPARAPAHVGCDEYFEWREKFLADLPHVLPSAHAMKEIEKEATLPDGRSGLLLIGSGDAICNVYIRSDEERRGADAGRAKPAVLLTELIVNPALKEMSSEIEDEIALRVAAYFGESDIEYRTLTRKKQDNGYCQSMVCGIEGAAGSGSGDDNNGKTEPFFGFPFE